MRHDEKYILINQGFAGKQRLMPFFNRQNNDDLILAIQAAGVSRGRNGFRKDKGGEKLAESEVIGLPLSQYAEKEHSSNTAPTAPTRFLPCGRSYFVVDTLYIGAEKFPYRESYAFPTTGIL